MRSAGTLSLHAPRRPHENVEEGGKAVACHGSRCGCRRRAYAVSGTFPTARGPTASTAPVEEKPPTTNLGGPWPPTMHVRNRSSTRSTRYRWTVDSKKRGGRCNRLHLSRPTPACLTRLHKTGAVSSGTSATPRVLIADGASAPLDPDQEERAILLSSSSAR
jgi:hypothetical protein